MIQKPECTYNETLGEKSIFQHRITKTKNVCSNTVNETKNRAESERLSTMLNVHHLSKYLSLVFVMLLEITERCHIFSD